MEAADIQLQVKVTHRQILGIAVPIAASILVPQVNFITNNIFLGGLGEQPLAVAGITGVYYLIFAVIGFGLNSGLQALISRRAGENRLHEIGNLFHQGLRITFVFSAISILFTYFLAPAILRNVLRDPGNVRMAVNFLYLRIWGLPFLYVYQLRNALLVGTNNSRYLISGTIAETIANIVFDYALIYGHFGLPEMGFNGAAVSSIIAEATGLFVIFGVMHRRGVSRKLRLFERYAFDGRTTRLILVQSLPIILQYVLSVTGWEFFYVLMEHQGEQALAISNTMRNIFGFFGCVTWAFASTTNSMVSNVIGQGMPDRVMGLILKIMKLSLGFACFIFILLNLAPGFFLQVYEQGNDFVNAAIPVVRVVSVAMLFMSCASIWLNSVIGTGNTKVNLAVEIGAITVYCVYVYTILEKLHMSVAAGWTAEWVYWSCILIPSFMYMRSGRWKSKKI